MTLKGSQLIRNLIYANNKGILWIFEAIEEQTEDEIAQNIKL